MSNESLSRPADQGSVIVSGARTPIGRLSGSLSTLTAMELGGVAIAAALERAGIRPEEVDHVLMGHVIQAGQGQITARQAAAGAGIPMTVPATTINKVCLSGLNVIHLADLMIGAGEADVIVAGGMESMSLAPYLLPGARAGYRLGNQRLLDSMMRDALECSFHHESMGEGADRDAARGSVSRVRQDEFVALSHERAAAAAKEGRLAGEIVPVTVAGPKGSQLVVEADEGVRPGTTIEALAKLKPAFVEGGSVTAGNSSQISDGAAALVVVSPARAEALGMRPLGEVIGYGQVAGPDTSLLTQPSRAVHQALGRAGLAVGDVDLFEINEAFAVVALASMDDLGITESSTNVNGGAIALGHPVGMSGTRIALTLLSELGRRGGGVGAASLCGGGGQGDALLVRSPAV